MAQLSAGALEALMAGRQLAYPVYMQLQEVKTINNKTNAAAKRYRIIVRDGKHVSTLMLSTQMAGEIEQHGDVYTRGSILEFSECIANDVQERRVMIAINFQKVAHVEEMLGADTPLEEVRAGGQQQAQHAQHAPGGHSMSGPPPGAGPHQDQNIPPNNGQAPPGMYNMPQAVKQEGMPHSGPPLQQGQGPPQTGMYGQQYGQQGQYGGPPAGGPGPQYGGGNAGPPQGGPGGWNRPPAGAAPTGAYGTYGQGPPGGGGMSGFLGRAPAPQYNMGASGPVARNEAAPRFFSINALSPYSGRWAIKARCTSKSEMKRFTTQKGDGRLFSFDLADKDGEIRATAFNEQADKFYDLLQVGQIYMVTKASLSAKKPEFNNTAHSFEIRLDRESVVEPCPEDAETSAIPHTVFNFCPIADLETMRVNAFVDVIGIVEQVNDWSAITRKTGEETRKRSLVLRDDSNRSIEVTLWGAFVDDPGTELETKFKAGEKPVVAFKSLRIGDFNGRNLGSVSSSVVRVNPTDPAAKRISEWYSGGGSAQQGVSLSSKGGGGGGRADRRCTLAAIRDENLGREGKPDYVGVMATIHMLGGNDRGFIYPACPQDINNRKCNKKMQDMDNGSYACPVCGPGDPIWRYMLSLAIADHTKSEWITAFSESGEILFGGMTADEFRNREIMEPGFKERMQDSIMYRTLSCRLKVFEDNYNDETRLKFSLAKIEYANPVKEGYHTLDLINKLEQHLPVLSAREAAAPAQQGGGAVGTQRYGGGGGYGGAGPSAARGTQAGGAYGGYNAAPTQSFNSNHMMGGGGVGGSRPMGGPGGPGGSYGGNAPGNYGHGAPGAPMGGGGGGGGYGGPPPAANPGGGAAGMGSPYGGPAPGAGGPPAPVPYGGGGGGGAYGAPAASYGGGGGGGGGYGGPGAPAQQQGGWGGPSGPGGPPGGGPQGYNGGPGNYGAAPVQQQPPQQQQAPPYGGGGGFMQQSYGAGQPPRQQGGPPQQQGGASMGQPFF